MRKDIYRNGMAVAKSRIDDSHSERVARSRFSTVDNRVRHPNTGFRVV